MMAQQRRPSHRVSSAIDNSLIARRKLQTRRGPISRRRVFTLTTAFHHPPASSHASVASSGSSPSSPRPVLVPLHFNLRRLPSRLFVEEPKEEMHDAVPTGSKRKRVVSGSENTLVNGRGSRGGPRVKRRRAMHDSSDEDGSSSMEVDEESRWEESGSEDDEDGIGSSECHHYLINPRSRSCSPIPADNYLINAANLRELLRLRKDELVRLYIAAGLTEDAELLTKQEIADCIIIARDDVASLPPSSPGAGDSGSSDYSSDGGNVAGGEETDFGHRFRNGMKRRATLNDMKCSKRRPIISERFFSLTQMEHHARSAPTKQQAPKSPQTSGKRYDDRVCTVQCHSLTCTPRRRSGSARSSPTTSITSTRLPSPPATRSRSRKLSNDSVLVQAPTSGAAKGKGKQVEFFAEPEVQPMSDGTAQESDLTDLETLEKSIRHTSPSPRRLRSQGSRDHLLNRVIDDLDLGRRVTPARRVKRQVNMMK